jgi:hypothetical protein
MADVGGRQLAEVLCRIAEQVAQRGVRAKEPAVETELASAPVDTVDTVQPKVSRANRMASRRSSSSSTTSTLAGA